MVRVLNSTQLFHTQSRKYWENELETYERVQAQLMRRNGKVTDEIVRRSLGGDEDVRRLRKMLRDGLGVKRSDMQVKIHQTIIEAMLPKLYQKEWAENKARILIDYGLDRLQQEVLIVMARRRGKTYSVSMIAAAILLIVSECTVAIFSTTDRMSRALMDVVKMFIKRAMTLGTVSEQDYKIKTDNKDCLELEGPDGTSRKLLCLPGTARVSLFFRK